MRKPDYKIIPEGFSVLTSESTFYSRQLYICRSFLFNKPKAVMEPQIFDT